MEINIPSALVLGCNTPHGIGVLSDWIEEQTGIAPDLHNSGWGDCDLDSSNIGCGCGYSDGGGYGNGDFNCCYSGNGYGSGYGYPDGNGIGNSYEYH